MRYPEHMAVVVVVGRALGGYGYGYGHSNADAASAPQC